MKSFRITQEQYDAIIARQNQPAMMVGDTFLPDTQDLWMAIAREHGVDWSTIGPDGNDPLNMKGKELA